MSEYRRVSRADKHTKRRNNNKKLLFFVGLAVIFIIILLLLILFGNKDDVADKIDENQEDINLTNEKDLSEAESSIDSTDDEQLSMEESADDVDEIEEVNDVVIQQIESTDENVIEAYTGNWAPIETTQAEPHTTNYNDGSEDRKEIKRAVSIVTGIDEANIVEHWVGNGGDQKVITTVSKKDTDDYYHIYLTWIEQEGWQVTKVERIKEIQNKKN